MQPTPVILLGKSHGQRSLAGYRQRIGAAQVGHDLATKPPPPLPMHEEEKQSPGLIQMTKSADHLLLVSVAITTHWSSIFIHSLLQPIIFKS